MLAQDEKSEESLKLFQFILSEPRSSNFMAIHPRYFTQKTKSQRITNNIRIPLVTMNMCANILVNQSCIF